LIFVPVLILLTLYPSMSAMLRFCKRGKRPGGKSFGLSALVGCGRSTRADGCRFPWRGISDSIAGCRLPISIHFRLPS
jgi:hypothetical protein